MIERSKVSDPDEIAFQFNMSLQEFLDRGTMRRMGVNWNSFVNDCCPQYPNVDRTRLKGR